MYDASVMDPALFAHVDELRAIEKLIQQAMPEGVDVGTPERVAAMRAAEASGAAGGVFAVAPGAGAESRRIPGPAGEIRLHVLRPPEVRAVYLHIHGGGWTLGRPEMNDASNWPLAQQAKLAIVSVDYRLAPEHPYPAGPDDCEAAALWLLEHAGREFGSERLLVGGESAGAHLAAVTLLRLRDRHEVVSRFEGANLVYGCFDLSGTPSQRHPGYTPVLSRKDVDDMPDYFLPKHDPEERRQPDISPLFADLAGLPPALFTVGTRDRLLDDTLFMAARWHAAGNRTELALYPEAPHGFTLFPVAMARAAHARSLRFLQGIVSGEAGS
jgi:acetyl esterase/lipase